jgi:hypothetical protein
MPRLAREVKAYSREKGKNPKHETTLRGEQKKNTQRIKNAQGGNTQGVKSYPEKQRATTLR